MHNRTSTERLTWNRFGNILIMEEILDKITDFGDRAHGEQLRKYVPDRYMVHPVRVMEQLKQYTSDITILAAALLHDVLEDTPVTEREISAFLSALMNPVEVDKTVQLVLDLTDVYVKQDFPKLNRRTRKAKEIERLITISPEAQTIKYADILDNTSEISDNDPSFANIYLSESLAILHKLDRGDAELRQKAIAAVSAGLDKLKKQ